LAAAIIAAELLLSGWDWMTRRRQLGFSHVPILLVGGITVGYTLFFLRFNSAQGNGFGREIQTPFNGNFGIKETSQVASNFAGLQFLTSHEAFVRLSISDLLFLRILFSETVLIPLGFTIAFILFGNSLNRRHRFTVLAFCVYIGIVTNTDFNSFRQNIPLMPLMGMVILDFLRARKQKVVDADERIFTTADRPPIATRNTELSTSR
jgi:hypothetical protein